MDTFTSKILVYLICVFILFTVLSQVFNFFDNDYKTETAILYSSAEKVTFNGIYVRDETVVTNNTTGVLSYPNVDGSRIAKGSVIAYVYKSENNIYVNHKINQLKEEVMLLEKEQNPGTTDVARPEFIAELIEEKYQTITSMIARNDLEGLAVERKNLQSLMGIYQIAINNETDYNARIDVLNDKISDYEKKQANPADIVKASDSGYFISYVDGYESLLNPEKIYDIDIDLINEIVKNNGNNTSVVSPKAVGKMVDGYKWKLIGVVNTLNTDFKIGSTALLKLSSSPENVNVIIDDIIKTDEDDKSIIVLSCETFNQNFVKYRTERMELILNNFKGIKVPRNAIRFNNNNEKGVYVLLGKKISFKKLDIIYECDDYILSRITTDSNYISNYDNIIVEGEISPEVIELNEETTVSKEEINIQTNKNGIIVGSVTEKETQSETTVVERENDVE